MAISISGYASPAYPFLDPPQVALSCATRRLSVAQLFRSSMTLMIAWCAQFCYILKTGFSAVEFKVCIFKLPFLSSFINFGLPVDLICGVEWEGLDDEGHSLLVHMRTSGFSAGRQEQMTAVCSSADLRGRTSS